MNAKITLIFLVATILALIPLSSAGLVSYGMCQTACNAAWVTCYASAGLIAGATTAGAALPAAAITCNTIQGVCMASCAALLIAPTP